MPWDRVHAEAEVLEHHLSDDLEARIAAKLGNPTHDPHGDPIPSRGPHDRRRRHAGARGAGAGGHRHARPRLRRRARDAPLPRRARDRARAPTLKVVDKQPFGGPLFIDACGDRRTRSAAGSPHRCGYARMNRRPRSSRPPARPTRRTAADRRSPLQTIRDARALQGRARPARPRLRRRRRLHRPRQLRHQHRGRRQVRLHARVGDRRREPDGDARPVPEREDRHRDRHEPARSSAASTSRSPSRSGSGCRPRRSPSPPTSRSSSAPRSRSTCSSASRRSSPA